jgi:hypothetical protein
LLTGGLQKITYPMKSLRILIVAGLTGLMLAACASTQKKADEFDEHGMKIEYVYYTPTGSNIPVRVRKDQMQTSESETNASQEALRKAQRDGTRQPKGS